MPPLQALPRGADLCFNNLREPNSRTDLTRRANHGSFGNVCPAPREKINPLIISVKQKYGSAIPPRCRGRCGQSSPNVRRGCDGRGGHVRRTWPWRTAKSCGPGLPTLRPSRRDYLADDGSKKARFPGRARRTPLKPLRREGRMFGQTCGDCRQLFYLLAGHGCGLHPAFPAPS